MLPLKRTANAGVAKRMTSFCLQNAPMACEPQSLWQSSSHPSLPAAGVIPQIVVVRKAGLWRLKTRRSGQMKLISQAKAIHLGEGITMASHGTETNKKSVCRSLPGHTGDRHCCATQHGVQCQLNVRFSIPNAI